MNKTPSEHELHGYIDGHLEADARVRVEAALAADPELAARVAAWQRDARALRSAFTPDELRPNPELDPTRIRQRSRQQRARRLAVAASLIVSLGMGGLGGWQLRGQHLAATDLPMSDALQAYRMLVMEGSLRPDMVQERPGDLQAWLGAHFADAASMPDLQRSGFTAVSGRLMPTGEGPAAMVIYRDAQGRSITFYIRPPGREDYMLRPGERRDGELMARYWSGQGYNYALVGTNNADMERTLRAATEG
jgi:anti-sigma factor RsiW